MKVLIATDGSPNADNAAWFLSHLPHAKRLELIVLSVQRPLLVHGTTEVVAWMSEQQEADKAAAAKACQRVEEMFRGAHADVEIVTSEGHPGKEIVSVAERLQVDLVVLGAEGHSVVERMLLGSVSDFVAMHAPCSVLIVRPTGLREREHRELSITVAYDASAPAKRALRELSGFDWQHHTRFSVINVMELPTTPMDIPITIDMEPVRAANEVATEDAVDYLLALSSNVESCVTESSHAGNKIVRYAEEQRSDMIVVGNTGMGLVGQYFLGSVSRYIVRHAKCSVWIGRERDEA